MKKEKGWAIYGVFGLYTGWRLTKQDAINEHILALGKTWEYCKAKGDRAVKVELRVIEPLRRKARRP